MSLTSEVRELLPLLAKVILQDQASFKSLQVEASHKRPNLDIRLQCSRPSPYSASLSYKVSRKRLPQTRVTSECVRLSEEKSNEIDFKKIGLEPLLESLYDALFTLTPREVDILKKRYCFSDSEDWTLDILGKEYGISRQRVKQIEQNALKKLRQALNEKFAEK